MTKRAVLYARVSSDDRDRDDRNLLGQLDQCRQYALEHGYDIVDELAEDDRGASGAAFDLPQLTRVRELARTRACDVLVVREIDRLSRSLEKQLLVEDELKRNGVVIEYVLGEYPDTPEGNLHKHVRAAVAEYERLVIKERVARGRDLKVKAGNVMVYGRPPFGYRAVKRDHKHFLEVDEETAAIVRQIFAWYTVGDGESGPLSTHGVHRKLHELGVPSPADLRPEQYPQKRRARSRWNRTTIARILENETYVGTWHWRKSAKPGDATQPEQEPIAVPVPAIISQETWQAALEKRTKDKARGRPQVRWQYLLSRRVVCGRCGSGMGGFTKQQKFRPLSYYRCDARDRSLTQYSYICDLPFFRANDVEAAVWDWVKSLLNEPTALTQGLDVLREDREQEKDSLRARLEAVERQLADKRRRLARLLERYLAGNVTQEALAAERDELTTAITALEREQSGLAARLEALGETQDRTAELQEFAAQVAEGLADAEGDFAFRRFVIENLDVRVTLAVEDGQKVALARCLLGEVRLPVGTAVPKPVPVQMESSVAGQGVFES
jgi:site-specific DNA recombinase